uniref:TrbI/VirB10 family protein n=1 Tax=Parerythrobacter lutipelagi TaxID=1964208 RepID=UPI001F000273|nr:TrbI/VirB10 family protein [Parerythrobacter lutipelagi]
MSDASGTYPDDGLPVVASRKSDNFGLIMGIAFVALAGIAVFWMLSSSRDASGPESMVLTDPTTSQRISSPPPLALPPAWQAVDQRPIAKPPIETRVDRLPPVRVMRVESPATEAVRPVVPAPQPSYPPPPTTEPRPSVVFDTTFNTRDPAVSLPTPGSTNRVRARRFENPALTIPQGTVIPAVLETALDSTRPGGVRALVQRDVRGFDGSRVLIQRGSRLYGEYEADLQAGQKRASIRWSRLIRPDGVTIALDSPASDPLGRAGVKGRVDSKFFQRFGGALLQSVLDIGVGIATSRATDGVVVALPGSTQNVQIQDGSRVQPTLKVRHGTSVSVFVARDLDFSSVDR